MGRSLERLLGTIAQHALVPLLFVFLAASLCIDGFTLLYQPSYTIGDWLINYSDGFVRRGLPGQVLLLLGHMLRVPVPWLGYIIPAIIYSLFLYGIYRLAAPLKRSFLWFALLFSPAAIPFIVLNGIHIGYRKETLICAGLVLAILLLRAGISDLLLSLSLVAIFAVLVLSHEAMIVCLPYFFAAVAIYTRDLKRAIKICLAPFLVAVALLVVVGHHPGDLAVAKAICSSVGGQWVETPAGGFPGMDFHYTLCSGSIAWLTVSRDGYHQQMAMTQLHFIPMYASRLFLACLPLGLALWWMYRRDELHYEVKVIVAITLICFVGVLGLFYSTIDWGRWIYMQNICLLLVILMAAQRAPSFLAGDVSGIARSAGPWLKVAIPLLTLVYCTCWTVPVNGSYPLRRGYLQMARFTEANIRYRMQWNAQLHLGRYGEPIVPSR